MYWAALVIFGFPEYVPKVIPLCTGKCFPRDIALGSGDLGIAELVL